VDRIEGIAQNFIGPLMVDDAKILVSTPYPPASLSGEPPALRSGYLQSQYDFDVVRPDPLSVTVVLRNHAPYADRLVSMGRDVFDTVLTHWEQQGPEVINEILSSG
jgi:hypothetical protein